MKFEKEKMADKWIVGLTIMKGVMTINLPYYDFTVMTSKYWREREAEFEAMVTSFEVEKEAFEIINQKLKVPPIKGDLNG